MCVGGGLLDLCWAVLLISVEKCFRFVLGVLLISVEKCFRFVAVWGVDQLYCVGLVGVPG